MRALVRRVTKAAVLGTALAAGASCSYDDPTGTEAMRPVTVVHAVLDPGRGEQLVLVARTVLGPPSGNPAAPAGFQGGAPVCDARVVLRDARGDSAVALPAFTEGACARGDALAGRYVVATRGPRGCGETGAPPEGPQECYELLRGMRYSLAVTTPTAALTGETRIPDVVPVDASSGFPAYPLRPDAAYDLVDLVVTRGVFHRITVEGDPVSTVLSDRVVGATIAGYRVSIFAFGDRSMTTYAYPCNRSTRLLFTVVDSNYRAHLTRDPTHEVLQQGETGTGLRGGRGVFGAVVTYAAPRLVPSFSPALDATGRVAVEPLGEWTPAPGSDGALPALCIHEATPASGGPRALTGVSAPTPQLAAHVVRGFLVHDGMTGLDSVELTLPLRLPGTGAAPALALAGRLLGDTLDLEVVLPLERRGERVRLTRTWPAGPR